MPPSITSGNKMILPVVAALLMVVGVSQSSAAAAGNAVAAGNAAAVAKPRAKPAKAKPDERAALQLAIDFVNLKIQSDKRESWNSLKGRLEALQKGLEPEAKIHLLKKTALQKRRKTLRSNDMMFDSGKSKKPTNAWLIELPNVLAGGFEVAVDSETGDIIYVYPVIEG